MKIISIFLFAGILFNPFANAQQSSSSKDKKNEQGEFIILKDSSKLVGNVSRKKGKILLDEKEYDISELIGFKEDKYSNVIIGPNIHRVYAIGKIQAYLHWDVVGGGGSGYTMRLRKANGNGYLFVYTTENLYELIQDNEEAVKEFDKHYRRKNNKIPVDFHYSKLLKVLAVYNGGIVQHF